MRKPRTASIRRAVEARQGWTWGRKVTRGDELALDVPPARVSVVLECAAIEYEAAKGVGAPLELWRHEHARPYPVLCTDAATDAGVTRSSRDCPRPKAGRVLYRLGRAVACEGRNPLGESIRVEFPRGVELHADPVTKRIHFVRRGAARRGVAPFHYATAGSPYTLTNRGIER